MICELTLVFTTGRMCYATGNRYAEDGSSTGTR
jgi:hypothetical protein